MGLGFNRKISWGLIVIGNVAVFAWAIYFRLPFFLSRTNRQRFLISAVIAVPTVFLAYYGAAALLTAALDFGSTSDKRTESVTLPSGEILENHTYYESGFRGGDRFNELYLKNPATGTSERVDAYGDLNYEDDHSLLQRYSHPQEIVRGDEKVLVIGPYVCKRWNWKKGPYWYIDRFDMARGDAANYLKSFVKTNSTFFSPYSGPEEFLHYQIENLDLENNVLTVKRIPWNAQVDFPELRDFPDYLVFNAVDYNGKSGYQFPWKFDVARTKAKNGPLWDNPMPFKMALDFSVVTFQKPGERFFNPKDERNVALTRGGAKEIAVATLELSDKELRSAECKYAILTNPIVDKIEAMFGFACLQTNRFYIIWQPHDPAAWPVPTLNLNEWALVDEQDFQDNILREEFIRIRQTGPALPPRNEGLDNTGITIRSAKFGAKNKIADVTSRVIELLHTNADGFTVNMKTLGNGPFPGGKKHLTIKYEFKGFNFTSTNSIGDDVSYQILINNARK